jgi:hypothetical protein
MGATGDATSLYRVLHSRRPTGGSMRDYWLPRASSHRLRGRVVAVARCLRLDDLWFKTDCRAFAAAHCGLIERS